MRPLTLFLCIFTVATCAAAQTTPKDRPDRSSRADVLGAEDKDNITGQVLGAASGASASASVKAAPLISLEGTTDDKVVKAQIGVQHRNFTMTLGAKADVGNDPNQAVELADLDGLRNKTTGEFGLLWSKWYAGFVGDVNPVLDQICHRYAEVTGQTEGTGDGQFKCRIGWFRKNNSAAAQAAYHDLIDRLTPGKIFFAGVNASVAPESFKFVSADTLVEQPTEKHTSHSSSALAGVAFRTNTVTTVSYVHDIVFKAGDNADVCAPLTTGGSLKCIQAAIGPPGEPERTNRLSFELKQFIGTNFAFAPKLNWDVHDSILGIQLPIYLLQAKAGGLTGGVTLGWRSDTKAFTASAFVGPVLRLIAKE